MSNKFIHGGLLAAMFEVCASILITYASVAIPIAVAGPAYTESFDARDKQSSSFHGHGGCFPYNTSFSDKITHAPGSSLRMELHGEDKNDVGCKAILQNVSVGYTPVSGLKSRNEIELGDQVSRVSEMQLGETNWYGWSVYFPSNEGSFASWWKRSDRIIIGQISGYGSGDSTVEVLLMIGNSGRLDFESRYSTASSSVEQVKKYSGVAVLKPDQWSNIAIKFKRSHVDGVVQIYVNGTKVVEQFGPSAIKENALGRFKLGMYFGYEPRNESYVSYIDEVRVGDSFEDVQPGANTSVAPVPPVLNVE